MFRARFVVQLQRRHHTVIDANDKFRNVSLNRLSWTLIAGCKRTSERGGCALEIHDFM